MTCQKFATFSYLSALLIFSIPPLVFAQIQAPNDLDNCVLWLDGADVDGDFTEGGAFANGNTWIDKSTAGNAHARQGIANARPEVLSEGLNGLTTVLFDGDDFMDLDSASFGMLNGVEGCTLFGLAKSTVQPARGGQRVLMIASGTNSAATRAGLNMFDSFGDSLGGSGDLGLAGRRLDSDGFQRIEGGEIVLEEFVQWAGIFDYTNQTLSLFAEGELVAQVTNFPTVGSTSPTDSTNIRIGADAALDSVRGLFTGEMAELITYNRTLSETERQEVEEYLNNKWFTEPISLPLSLTIQPSLESATQVTLQATGPVGDYILASTSDLEDWDGERLSIEILDGEGWEMNFPFEETSMFFRLETTLSSE